jgi:hypothetical protein
MKRIISIDLVQPLVIPVLSNHADVIGQRRRIVQRGKMTTKFLDCRLSASSVN